MTEEDLPILFEQQLDPEANRMAAFAARDRDAFMAHWRTRILGDDAVVKQTIVFEGRVAGNIVSFERDGQPEVGYWVGREFWGRGIATGALSEFLEQVTTRPVFAHVARHNVASIRVLQKCEFAILGEVLGPPGPDGEDVEELILKLE